MRTSKLSTKDLSPFARKCFDLWAAQGLKRGMRPGTKEFDLTVKNLNRLKNKKVFRYLHGDRRKFSEELEFIENIPQFTVGHFSKALSNYMLALQPGYRPVNKKFLKSISLGKFIASPVFLKNYFGHSPFLHFLKNPPLPAETIYLKKDAHPIATKVIIDFCKDLYDRKLSVSEMNTVIANTEKFHNFFHSNCIGLNEKEFAKTVIDTIEMNYNGNFKIFMIGSDVFMDKYKDWLRVGGYMKPVNVEKKKPHKQQNDILYVCTTPIEDAFLYPEIYEPLPANAEIL